MSRMAPSQGPERDEIERWIRATQEFRKAAAPNAFKWIGWCLILAAIRFAQQKTAEWPLQAIWWLLIVLMWGYFAHIFFERDIKWRSRKEMFGPRNLASWAFGALCTVLMISASIWLSNQLMRYPLG